MAGDSTWPAEIIAARSRVIIDNDFSGDPDGLVQLAHHLLSPSVDVRLVIGSHLREGDPWDPTPDTADRAAVAAGRIAEMTNRTDVAVVAGSNRALVDRATPAVRPRHKPSPIGPLRRSLESSSRHRAGCAAMRRRPTPWPSSSTCCPMMRSVGTRLVGWWNWSGATATTLAAALSARR
jgi:hypothetical protein